VSQLRLDPFTETWCVIAPQRRGIGGLRPGGLPETAQRCPFCPGHEADTERTVLAIGEPWQVRVVENRFPLVWADTVPTSSPSIDAMGATERQNRDPAPFVDAPARGVHEVVIEARDHVGDLWSYSPSHASRVLRAIRDRVRALEATPGVRSVVTFRNRGRRAGSSQPHPHSQIVALGHVPVGIARRAEIALRGAHRETLLARTLAEESRAGVRIISEHDRVIAWCPFASSRAWETRIALQAPCPRFSAIDDASLDALADRLRDVTARMRRVLAEPDYNVLVRDLPIGSDDAASFFTLDVLPRTGGDAGFELATGTPICVVAPEHTAEALRGAG
jgi:UDPglucose--hexose-1-phosphate uridylyltransferase